MRGEPSTDRQSHWQADGWPGAARLPSGWMAWPFPRPWPTSVGVRIPEHAFFRHGEGMWRTPLRRRKPCPVKGFSPASDVRGFTVSGAFRNGWTAAHEKARASEGRRGLPFHCRTCASGAGAARRHLEMSALKLNEMGSLSPQRPFTSWGWKMASSMEPSTLSVMLLRVTTP